MAETQVILSSEPGQNPADFDVTLINHIKLDVHKEYRVSLHNAILSASWNTAPVGVAYTVNGVDKSIPAGHFDFNTLKEYIKNDFEIEAITYSGKVKVVVPVGSTVVLKSLAPKIGFATDTSLVAGEHTSTNIASLNPVTFISCSCSLVDINSTRSNVNAIRPTLRTALLPECLEPYQFFDMCRVSDDYEVRSIQHEISTIGIRLTDQDGNTLGLDPSLKTYFTLLIREVKVGN